MDDAELLLLLTERAIYNFIKISKLHEVSDETIEKALCTMIVRGFHEYLDEI